MTSAANVYIYNNIFLNNFCFPSTYIDQFFPWIIAGSLIEFSNVQNVYGSGNTISNPAGCQYVAASPVTATGSASNVNCC